MKTKTSKILAPMVLGATLLQLAACGGGGGGSTGSGTGSSSLPRQFEQDAEGMYAANLVALNNGVGGPISGNVSVVKEGDRMIAYLRLNGGHASTSHQQRVHIGTSCPTKADDKNGDGYIDINEAYASVGKILFPLDADISAQERGSSLWPMGDIYGYYHWERATSFSRFISDLREPDLNEENDYAKLGPNGPLNLDSRVVLIHGANATLANLPDTVGTRGRLANYQTIPVACAVIRKVQTVPGEFEDDPSLGAAGEGETVGGSSGADDGATIPVDGVYRPDEETTAGSTTGTTNDADNDPRSRGNTTGGTSGDDDDNDDGGFRWPWERHPRTTTGGSEGGTSGGTTSGGTTSGGTTTGGTTGGTSGGTTGSYGDDDGDE